MVESKSVEKYLIDLLQHIKPYQLSNEDNSVLSKGKTNFITSKLTRKKFRRRKLADKTRDAIQQKVELSIKKYIPLHFTIPFGGYKHFWNPSHPQPDYAELFNFRYITEYLSPILSIYEPGVIVEYISEDLILSRMNNYPKAVLEIYTSSFGKLLNWYKQFVPKNLEFRFFRVSDKCNPKEIIDRIEKLLPERRKKFELLSQKQKEQELHRSYRSMMWKGEKDLTSLSEKEKEERIIESRLIELAYYETEANPEILGNYLGEDNHICICFSFGLSHDNDIYQDLTLGSTFSSIVDYWIGRGILEERNNEFIPRIVSKGQYDGIKDKLKVVKINASPLKNLTQIEIFQG